MEVGASFTRTEEKASVKRLKLKKSSQMARSKTAMVVKCNYIRSRSRRGRAKWWGTSPLRMMMMFAFLRFEENDERCTYVSDVRTTHS